MIVIYIVFSLGVSNVFAQQSVMYQRPDIKIVMNGVIRNYSTPPIIYEGRTLLPLRELAYNIGMTEDSIVWDGEKGSVLLTYETKKVYLKIGSTKAIVDEKELDIDVSPIIYQSRTYIPVRFVSASFGKIVAWDGVGENVFICDKLQYNTVKKILGDINNAMSYVNKVKFSNDYTFQFELNGTNNIINTTSECIMDFQNKLFYTLYDRKESDRKKKVEIFGHDVFQSIRSDSGEWKNIKLDNQQTSKIYGFSSLKETDILCCALSVDYPPTGDMIILEGISDLFDYSNSPISLEGFKNYKLDSIRSRIIVDSKTKFVKEISLNATLPQKHKTTNSIINFGIGFKTKYYDYNGEYQVVDPTVAKEE
jgi:hypothetical protein